VYAKHYSEFNIDCNTPPSVIRIDVGDDWDNWIYQINVFIRAGDVPLEKKLSMTPLSVRNVPNKFRNEWYARFNTQEYGYNRPGSLSWRWEQTPAFNFSMKALFDPLHFYKELLNLAKFLNMTFVPDTQLHQLLMQFLKLNQGWQYYSKSKHIVDCALSGQKVDFTSDEILQALINSLLTQSVGIFDGKLFANDQYPSDTAQLWCCIEEHLQTFDQRF
jgi:hypothetical protein